ncbi:MAG TPA: precorrin-4 C(11)-methyltransferase [Dissulfurispiraceae bacterium]|nr:precorrin-4 C(11)-methyltransferase [Dissulfurispiraceae bacterium]
MAKVYFIGAGPGDPDLITIKGRRILESSRVVIYAGSLVNKALLEGLDAEIFDSASMTLDDTVRTMEKAVAENKNVARLHTGDPALYGAISEQIERLVKLGICYEVIPGVSSALAGAAVLGQELTIPEISQTVIFTRMAGKTPVPDMERISELAKHRATMVIFLSVGMFEKLRDELLQGYPEDTPVVVIQKATWPDQNIVRGTLADIVAKVKAAGIKKTALIYIGEALRASEGSLGMTSKLYDKNFTHEYRRASE